MLERYGQFMRETVTGSQVRRMSSFFDACSSFIGHFVAPMVPGLLSVDVVFINNQGQPVTYLHSEEDGEDRERLIDLSQTSLL